MTAQAPTLAPDARAAGLPHNETTAAYLRRLPAEALPATMARINAVLANEVSSGKTLAQAQFDAQSHVNMLSLFPWHTIDTAGADMAAIDDAIRNSDWTGIGAAFDRQTTVDVFLSGDSAPSSEAYLSAVKDRLAELRSSGTPARNVALDREHVRWADIPAVGRALGIPGMFLISADEDSAAKHTSFRQLSIYDAMKRIGASRGRGQNGRSSEPASATGEQADAAYAQITGTLEGVGSDTSLGSRLARLRETQAQAQARRRSPGTP